MRRDGKRLRDVNPIYTIIPHILPERNDALNSVSVKIPYAPLHSYINEKRKAGETISHMAVMLAAYVRVLAQYPVLNRFVVNKKIYAHNDVQVALVVLKPGSESDETMGKVNQLGTLDEVLELCKIAKCFSPVVDFGHLNARDRGVFYTADDYKRVFDKISHELGAEYAENLHCHFSKIMYTDMGEKKHLTFEDEVYGPNFEPLAEAIVSLGVAPTIICESAGTQSDDAVIMKMLYEQEKKKQIALS